VTMWSLLADRRFRPLLASHAAGAAAANLFRAALVWHLFRAVDAASAGGLIALATALSIAPFLLAAVAGQLGDRSEKADLLRRVRLAGIAVAALAALAVIVAAPLVLLVAALLVGAQGALAWPLTGALIPQLVEQRSIMGAHALVVAVTFGAIALGVLGVALAGMADGAAGNVALAVCLVALAATSWLASRRVPAGPVAAPELPLDANPWWATRQIVERLQTEPGLFWSSLGIVWFWLLGGLQLAALAALDPAGPGGDRLALMIALVALGIALGALLTRVTTAARISLTPVPFAALAMALLSVDLWFAARALEGRLLTGEGALALLRQSGGVRLLLDMFLVSIAAGIYVVPLYALLQVRVEPAQRTRTLAATDVLSALGVLIALTIGWALLAAGAGVTALLLITAAGSLVVAWLVMRRLAAYVLKGLFQAIFRLAFRVEVEGAEHIARAGPRTLVVVNHVSWLDGPLLMAFLPELPVFAVQTHVVQRPWLRPFRAIAHLYPIDPTDAIAAKDLIGMVKNGQTCVIFPEGRISVTGALMKVYPGPAYIADKADAAIVPVRIDGAERTHFSRLDRGQVRRRLFPKIRITILEPQRLQLAQDLVGKPRRAAGALQLYDIMSDMVFRTTRLGPTLFAALLDARARFGGPRQIIEDFKGEELTYNRLVLGAMALGRRFEADTRPGERIGVLLPNVEVAAVVFYALQAFARVPALLNFSAGIAAMDAALTAAEVKLIITSRAFVEQAQLEPAVAQLATRARILWLEDLRDEIGAAQRLRAWWESHFARRIHKSFAVQRDMPAVVLFTSGSEGRPKGVVLSHGNILANCAQAAARVDYNQLDRVFNSLPLFHSFGLTAAFVLPNLFGLGVFLYPSPLHYRIVPEMVYGSNATILFGTNSFLRGYGRAADPYDFRGVRYVFAGAERVQDETRELWTEKFGIRLLDGYGATEAAPAITTNTPMHNRRGTVGRFLPGIQWRLEPIEGLERGAQLWIKGPNVMLGYLRFEQPGVLQPPPDGWYDTGDIAEVDAEGYLTLLGRAKRFAKLGGEMVSLAVVEEIAAEAAPDGDHAATAVPDSHKGERILLVTTSRDLDRDRLSRAARTRGLSELVVPADVIPVEQLPLLGSGKTDYPAVRRLVDERLGAAEPAQPA
jgi:acyl-[acyl-carrier-protein]-phospholipid O-acyltransferase / long-chain-fatty-acid--[acyl-carrier-protein] ligase